MKHNDELCCRSENQDHTIVYKTLIVDDEAVERDVIRYLIKQNQFPLEVYEAENGEDALKLMESVGIDILLTDIRMPFIDGITLATRAKEIYHDIFIIFFTGYNDFSYLKEALLLNATNYILKPVNEVEFKNTLISVMEKLQNERAIIQTNEIKNKLLQNHILQHIVNGMEYSQLTKRYSFVDLSFLHNYYQMIIIQVKSELGVKYSVEEDLSRAESIKKLLPDGCLLHNSSPLEYIVFLEKNEKNLGKYRELLQKISMQIQRTLSTECNAEISKQFENPSEIYSAYLNARNKLNKQFFKISDEFCEDEAEKKPMDYERGKMVDLLVLDLQRAVRGKDSESSVMLLTQIFQLLTMDNKYSYLYFCHIMTTVTKTLLDLLPDDNRKLFDEYMKKIYRFSSVPEVECFMIQITNNVINRIKDSASFDSVSNQIKKIIHTHYMDDLGLEVLAEEVHLSPQYLSVLFAEKNGCGVNKYIKNVRMNKAKELLENTNLRIKDICTRVGYNNYSYFCKIFAEEFGKTPQKYRDSLYI